MSVLILVGAGPGLGRAIARRFGRGGHKVGMIARQSGSLDALSAELEHKRITTATQVCDAGQPDALRLAIERLVADLGPCTTLIYNAAVLRSDDVLAIEPEKLEAEMAVNVGGALTAAQTVAPGMIAEKSGAILFTGGGLALEPYPEWASLGAGKAALRSLSFSLYKRLAPQGLHVAVVAVCGIVKPGGPFDPDRIAEEYWRLSTTPRGLLDRELIFQPAGTDPYYNDPKGLHSETTPGRLPVFEADR